jgi:MFS family permease
VAKSSAPQGQDQRFLLLYALALAGGTIAYVPFLTILLPMQIASLAAEAKIAWLAYATFAGALTASLANIAFGWLSDRTASRLPLVIAGLLLSSVLLVSFAQVESFLGLMALVIGWQATLNMMLAPLAAWAGDCVPDHQKGTLGGLISIAPAAGALSAAFITLPGLANSEQRLWLVAALVLVMVVPALVLGRPRHFPELLAARVQSVAPGLAPVADRLRNAAVIKMWLARLLIQVSESALFAFLYFWLRSLDSTIRDAGVAQLFCAVLVCSIPVSMLAGRWSDRHGRPLAPLPVAAVTAAGGLLLMSGAATPLVAMAGYALFALTAAVFLSLHSAQTLALLPNPARRGLHLGLFNLTNTAPAMIMPWLTLAIEPTFGFAGLFAVLAVCAFSAAALLVTIPHSRTRSPA